MPASRLSVIRTYRLNGKMVADCRCECGNTKTVRLAHLKRGDVKSCGCLKRETSRALGLANATHGHSRPASRSHTYRSWECMKSRCLNPSDPSYADYGGRGIRVCPRWMSFENFLQDMGTRPKGTTLDRIDVDGDYEPANCRWATDMQQGRNRRDNRLVEFRGERVPLVVVAEVTGVPYQRLHERIVRRGWAVDDAINIPSRKY